MGFISNIEAEKRASYQQAGPPRDPVVAEWLGGGANSATGLSVTPDGAMRVTVVYRAVSILAQTYASLPLSVDKFQPDGGILADKTHPLYDTIVYQPNKFQTSFEWREMMAGHFALRGRCYSEIVSSGGRAIDQLIPLHPDRVTPFRAPDGRLAFNYQPIDGPSRVILQSEMHWMHLMSTTGVDWISPIGLCREAVGLALATEEHAARLFSNGAKPGGILKMPGHFKDAETKKKFALSWQEAQGGLRNTARTAILENGMEWQQVGMTSEDAQFLEMRNFQLAEIGPRIFGVPAHKLGDLSRCMPADTLVFAEDGPKRISDIVIGDRVWTPSASGFVLNSVTNHWNNGERELLEIRTTNRMVRCTPNHRLLIRRKKLRDLLPGEIGGKNIGGKKCRVEWVSEYVEAGRLRIGDAIVTLKSLPSVGCASAPNGRGLTSGFMEFAGLLMADGNVTYESGRAAGIQIARGDDALYMQKYRDIMLSEFTKADGVSDIYFTESVRQTKFKSTIAASEMIELGLSGTAFTKRVPGWVFGLASEFRLSFLRGFLDGDGTVDNKGRITFYSANSKLLDDIRHLCMSCGIPVTNSRSDRNGRNAFCPKSGIPTLMFRFTCSDAGANSRIGSHDFRYIERLAKAKPFGRKDRAYPRFGGNNFGDKGMSIARISSIVAIPPEPTYDIEVEEEHCFVADGVISHNSTNNNIEHQGIEFVTDTIRPGVVRWEQAMQRDLFYGRRTHCVNFDMDGLMRGDSAATAAKNSSDLQNGVKNRNEIRRKDGLNPVDDESMDMYTVQSNMININDMGKFMNQKQTELPK